MTATRVSTFAFVAALLLVFALFVWEFGALLRMPDDPASAAAAAIDAALDERATLFRKQRATVRRVNLDNMTTLSGAIADKQHTKFGNYTERFVSLTRTYLTFDAESLTQRSALPTPATLVSRFAEPMM